MAPSLLLYGAFAFLATFNAGAMATLQIQHYAIYPAVGAAHFKEYIRANNRAAVVPVIIPAMVLLLVSALLLVSRPPFMSLPAAAAAFGLNVVQLASTFVWQRRLQAEMAETGYAESKVRLLVSTNWIRTFAFLAQGVLAIALFVGSNQV
jgi:hypothetical protein